MGWWGGGGRGGGGGVLVGLVVLCMGVVKTDLIL